MVSERTRFGKLLEDLREPSIQLEDVANWFKWSMLSPLEHLPPEKLELLFAGTGEVTANPQVERLFDPASQFSYNYHWAEYHYKQREPNLFEGTNLLQTGYRTAGTLEAFSHNVGQAFGDLGVQVPHYSDSELDDIASILPGSRYYTQKIRTELGLHYLGPQGEPAPAERPKRALMVTELLGYVRQRLIPSFEGALAQQEGLDLQMVKSLAAYHAEHANWPHRRISEEQWRSAGQDRSHSVPENGPQDIPPSHDPGERGSQGRGR